MNPSCFQMQRRAFLRRSSGGLGAMALASMLDPARGFGAPAKNGSRGVVNPLHHNPRVKRVIYLYMAGGMTHLETWDPKPTLMKMNGQPMPESVTKGQQIAQLQGAKLNCLGPQHPFQKYGKSGLEFSSIFPEIGARAADHLCIIRSMHTEAINHDPAHTFMNTGTMVTGKPSMGSWLWYGLGAETENLPGFVVMVSTGKFGQSQPIAARQWHSGFLPSKFQGVQFRGTGEPVLYINNPAGVDNSRQQALVRSVQELDRLENEVVVDPEIEARIAQYEMAFRMQASVPELMDVSKEPKKILELYGANPGDGSFASNCLLARRLAERGVRFIQLYHRDWDHHGAVKDHSLGTAKEVDRGTAALIEDLRQRGMLDDTLIVFGTEFGRTPMAQGNGRDHHMKGFSMWMAGGGIKGGISHGNTDEFGYNAVEKPVPVHDIHATMLHLMGIDHKRLTFPFQGRDFRLTDVHGNVLKDILA